MAEKKQSDVAAGGVVDLGSLDVVSGAESGAWMVPLHPTEGTPLDCRIRVLGEDSKAYVKAMNKVADMRADRQRTRRKQDPTFDDIRAAELILAIHLTAEWEGIAESGNVLPCTYEMKSRVYSQHRWLAEQVTEYARDRGNFFGK